MRSRKDQFNRAGSEGNGGQGTERNGSEIQWRWLGKGVDAERDVGFFQRGKQCSQVAQEQRLMMA
jgi:hypothetical protein